MKGLFYQKLVKQLTFETLGSILIAAAIYNFAVQAEFPMTGFSGISIILYRFFGISMGLSTILLNIPVAVLCHKLLGKHFFLNSLRCILISSIFIDYIAPTFPLSCIKNRRKEGQLIPSAAFSYL